MELDADNHTDELSFRWHDNLIYGLKFELSDSENQDWRSDLVLDIDFIAEWRCEPSGECRFSVAPATLAFHDVTDLSLAIDQGDSGGRVAMNEWSIDRVVRDSLGRPFAYWRWTIHLNVPSGGKIVFGASGFTQMLRGEPRLLTEQHLPRTERRSLFGPR